MMSVMAAAALMLTSCLGDSDSSYSASTFAVGTTVSGLSVLNSGYGVLYSSSIASSIVSGVCYMTSFEVDLGSAANENYSSNGYYVATITSLSEVEKGSMSYVATDTTQLLENEIPISYAGYSSSYGTYIGGYLFFGSTFTGLNNQVNDYTLYWDRTSSSSDPVYDDDDVPTYNLFLRAVKSSDGTGESQISTQEFRGYPASSILSYVADEEDSNGNDTFNLKVNYLSYINESDSTDLTWNSFTLTLYSSYTY